MDILLSCLTLAAVLVQGGYFPTVFLLCALVMGGMLIFTQKPVLSRGTWWAWALAGWYLCAALRGGYRSDTLAKAALPLCCALFLAVYTRLPGEKKNRFLNILITGSGILAGLFLLAFSGVLPLRGAVTSHRLQGTFQYANAAGSWFAAAALLTQDSEDSRAGKLALANITALFLTRSTGALGVYTVMQGVRIFLRRREGIWADALLLHVAALAFAGFFFLVPGWPAVPVLLLLYLLGWHWERLLPRAKKFRLHWVCVFLGGAAIGAFVSGERFATSLGTFVERLVQMKDGLSAICLHPVFGLGAGSWANLVPYYQSAQYSATVIHSGPVLIGVDAGIPAMLLAAGLIVSGWRRGGRTLAQSLAALLLVIHGVFDFTVCFYPLAALALALLFVGDAEAGDKTPDKPRGHTLLLRAGAAVCVLLSVWLLAGELETKRLNACINAQNWSEAAACYQNRKFLFGESQTARTAYLYALYGEGNMEEIVRATERVEQLSLRALLLRAQALDALGEREKACALVLEQLNLRLYQTELFQRTAGLLREWEVDGDTIDAYNRIVDRANASQTFLGSLLGNQVYIEKL